VAYRLTRSSVLSKWQVVLTLHFIAVLATNFVAFWLRFDGRIPDWAMTLFLTMLPVLVPIRMLTFVFFRAYQGMWRYASISDLSRIIAGVLASSLLFYFVTTAAFGLTNYPRSVYVIDTILLIVLLGGVRFSRRLCSDLGRFSRAKRILVYGAGDAGEMIVRDMKHSRHYDCAPIGFVDDDRRKVGLRIHGLPVFGTRADLPAILRREKPDEVLVAMPRAKPATIRQLVKVLEPFNVSIKTLPNLREFVNGTVNVSQIRNLSIEDLLAREPVVTDTNRLREAISGKRVMITGAGGSIGSELCRQVARLRPETMVLYERYENNLYTINNELLDRDDAPPVFALIGDVADEARVDDVLQAYKPDIIFHAAAHKHVPLMECSPCEAIKNNVGGTRVVASAADRHGIQRFVMISTDKAVKPSSVMGATKHLAELVIQDLSSRSRTNFLTVRFGNVLGSNGSVVPRFLDQIKAGGPVTVTHPEVERFFMLIPEAVQLVLQASSLAEPGAVYVLEMGEQIKLVDLARNLIRLSGFVPDDEIPIQFIGLRPGEKLSEELVGPDETMERSSVNKILRVRPIHCVVTQDVISKVTKLERLAYTVNVEEVMRLMRTLIPSLAPDGEDMGLAGVSESPKSGKTVQSMSVKAS
jgi:FlaA1/EpsC-like NDP-sugar epimerase